MIRRGADDAALILHAGHAIDERLQRTQYLRELEALSLALVAEALPIREHELLDGRGDVRWPARIRVGEVRTRDLRKVEIEGALALVDDVERRAARERDQERDAERVAVGHCRVVAAQPDGGVEVALGQVQRIGGAPPLDH